jgi:hypothetical protein
MVVERLNNGVPADVKRGFDRVEVSDGTVPAAFCRARSCFLLPISNSVVGGKSYQRKNREQ